MRVERTNIQPINNNSNVNNDDNDDNGDNVTVDPNQTRREQFERTARSLFTSFSQNRREGATDHENPLVRGLQISIPMFIIGAKILQEYILQIFAFLIFHAIREQLNDQLIQELKKRSEMSKGTITLVIISCFIIVNIFIFSDYENTGRHLFFDLSSAEKLSIGTNETSLLVENSAMFYSDSSRLLWVLATCIRVDLVVQCCCIGVKATCILIAVIVFMLQSKFKVWTNHCASFSVRSAGRPRNLTTQPETPLSSFSPIRLVSNNELAAAVAEEEEDILPLLSETENDSSSSTSSSFRNRTTTDLKDEEEGGGGESLNSTTITNRSDPRMSRNNRTSTSSFATYRKLRRRLCLIEALFLIWRLLIPVPLWCRYYGSMTRPINLFQLTNGQSPLPSSSFENNQKNTKKEFQIEKDSENVVKNSSHTSISSSTKTEKLKNIKANRLLGKYHDSQSMAFMITYLLFKFLVLLYHIGRFIFLFQLLMIPQWLKSLFTPCCLYCLRMTPLGRSLILIMQSFDDEPPSHNHNDDSNGDGDGGGGGGGGRAEEEEERIRTLENGQTTTETVEEECPICFEVCVSPIRLDPCGHIFCEDCASEWLEAHKTCPMCRASVRFETDENSSFFKTLNVETGGTSLLPHIF